MNSGLKPSFSQNRTALMFPDGPMTSTLAPAKVGGEDVRLLRRVEIVADLDRPAADAAVGVRLLEMPARVIDDVPVDAVLLDVVGQQGLARNIRTGSSLSSVSAMILGRAW